MNADTKEHVAETDASEAQFGLRALLGAMTLVAVFAGIAGFAIRRFPAESRSAITAYWGAMLAAFIAYLAWGFRRRKLAEQEAGPTLLSIDCEDKSQRVYWIGSRFVVALVLFVGISILLFKVGTDWFMLVLPTLMYVSWLQQMTDLLWTRRLRFCERGVLWGREVLPWSDLLEYYWTGSDNHRLCLRSVNDNHNQPWATVPVPAQQRTEVSNLLERNMLHSPRLPASARWVGFWEVPISVAVSEGLLRRHFVFAATSVVCAAILFYWGGIRTSGAREFDEAVQCVNLVAVIMGAQVGCQFLKRPGSPMARLFARRDLLGFVALMGMATGIFWAVALCTLWPEWLGYLLGIAYFYFSLTTASYYFLTQLDIRASGVAIPGAFFWPWQNIKIHYWDPERSSRLVLGRKWRRVTAFVPQEQRETVDRVLREKLGMPQETTQPRKEAVGEVVA